MILLSEALLLKVWFKPAHQHLTRLKFIEMQISDLIPICGQLSQNIIDLHLQCEKRFSEVLPRTQKSMFAKHLPHSNKYLLSICYMPNTIVDIVFLLAGFLPGLTQEYMERSQGKMVD